MSSNKVLDEKLKSVDIPYIENVFKDLGFDLRGNQTNEVLKIVKEFSKGKKYVVFAGSTGTGKSAIGSVVAEIIHRAKFTNKCTSVILSHTNVLSEQYEKMFKGNDNFNMIQGKSNYPCNLLSTTADKCILKRNKNKGLNSICVDCKYRIAKSKMNTTPHLITNYTFWLINQLYGDFLEERDITIYDECHVLNNVFSSNLEIIVNEFVIKNIIKKISTVPVGFAYIDKQVEVLLDLISEIEKDMDVKGFLKKYMSILSDIFVKYDNEAQLQHDSGDIESYKKLESICTFLENKISTLSFYFSYDYRKTEIVDWKKNELRIKPIYINELSNIILTSNYNLFMSATINESYMIDTLSLNKEDVSFIKSDTVFDAKLKDIEFANIERVNYDVQNSKEFIKTVANFVEDRLNDEGDNNGIIITPSFFMAETIYKNLKSDKKKKTLLHQSGVGLKDIINIFKTDKKYQYLISPSIWEGVSLDNDESKFQIVVKAPYPSLADDRMSFIASRHPGLYKTETMFKIIQGFGRSTRNKEDYSRIYCIDLNLWGLFKLKKNIWFDEFYVRVVGHDINTEEFDESEYPKDKVKKVSGLKLINVNDLY